jgi:hypothetical protein
MRGMRGMGGRDKIKRERGGLREERGGGSRERVCECEREREGDGEGC